MSHPYGTLTGLDYSGKKKKITASEPLSVTDKFPARTKYEKYSEKPEPVIKKAETPKLKEKTDAFAVPQENRGFSSAKLFFVFVALAGLMIVWIGETNYVREGLVEIEKLKDEKLELEKTNESIQVEITKLSEYQRIEKIATEKLRMIPSKEKPGVIFLDSDKAKVLNEIQKASTGP